MPPSPEHRIAELAARQHGVVSRRQLLEAGVTADAIKGRLLRGVLVSLHPGVYAFGHTELTVTGRWKAATLTSRSAVLSHRSAAALWGMGQPVLPIEILRRHGSQVRGGVRVRGTQYLPQGQVAEKSGIPVTTVERTLIDMAGTCSDSVVADAFSAARRLKIVDLALLTRLLDERPRKGAPRLRDLIRKFGPSRSTRSELESRFLSVCLDAGLPRPVVDAPKGSRYLDFVWTSERVIAEIDSREHHLDRFDEDRMRDLDHLARGFETVRVTHRMLKSPDSTTDGIRRVLVRRRLELGV